MKKKIALNLVSALLAAASWQRGGYGQLAEGRRILAFHIVLPNQFCYNIRK